MNDFERARATKRAEQDRLLAIPGVQAVGVGAKLVNGERTDDPAIVVFVDQKKPLSDLLPDDIIPQQIQGIKTDVVASGIPVLTGCSGTLMGGVQLWPGGREADKTSNKILITVGGGIGDLGTLGCFGKTSDGHIVAITCHHVVGIAALADTTPLHPVATAVSGKIVFTGQDKPNTCVVARIVLPDPAAPAKEKSYDVFYVTSGANTMAEIATGIAARITALGVTGLSAAAMAPPSAHVVQITAPAALNALDCFAQGLHKPDKSSDLKVTIKDTGTKISLQGRASQAGGAYIDFNVDGLTGTRGVFVPIAENDSASAVANKIIQKVPTIPGITATKQGNADVVIGGAQQLDCDVTSDIRVGSPKNWFCSECCSVCTYQIGIVTDTDISLDAATIQLDGGITYKPQIDDLGVIVGTYVASNSDLDKTVVQKHGITTNTTSGKIHCIDVSGNASAKGATDGVEWRIFHRQFSGCISITGIGNKFGDRGDSGSAVVVEDPSVPGFKAVKVLGILAAVSDTIGFVTPIGPILSRFNLTLETGIKMDDEKVVPKLAAAPGSPGAQSRASRALEARLEQIEREVTSTEAGRRYADLVRRHFPEARGLVNSNRRVGTVWRRNSGPEIINAFLNLLQDAERQIPATINEKPLQECVTEIQKILVRYGSSELADDLQRYVPPLAGFAGLTYDQALDSLRGLQLE